MLPTVFIIYASYRSIQFCVQQNSFQKLLTQYRLMPKAENLQISQITSNNGRFALKQMKSVYMTGYGL